MKIRRLLIVTGVVLLLIPAGCSSVGIDPSALLSGAEPAQEVNFESGGRALIVGSFYPPAAPNSPAVLLLHQWQSDRGSWDAFARQLQSKGFAVLAIDGRGFGDSVNTSDGRQLAPNTNNESVGLMLRDVDGALKFLVKQKDVDPSRIGIGGASYGSSLALMYAAEHPEVKAVALLSPGLNYFGTMPTEDAAGRYGTRALMLVAAKDDPDSAEAVGKLGVESGPRENLTMVVHPGGGHGTELFDTGIGIGESLERFFTTNL